MARRLLVFALIVLVVGLAWFQTRQSEELIEEGLVATTLKLFPQLDGHRVIALDVQNLERAVDVRLLRDPYLEWQMVDPLQARANPAMVDALLLELATGTAKSAPELNLEEAGLEPPKAVIAFTDAAPSGTRALRLEIGAIDVEGRYVYVRIPNHPQANRSDGSAVLLASRTWNTLLDNNMDAFRDPILLSAVKGGLARIVRSAGSVTSQQSPSRDWNLSLERDGQGGWRLIEPKRMQADDAVANAFVRGLLGLRADRFLADDAQTAARFGLDQPLLSFDLQWLNGDRERVLLGSQPPQQGDPLAVEYWVATVEGSNVVIALSPNPLGPLLLPAPVLYDQQFVRAIRTEIAEVELASGVGTRTFRVDRGVWSVTDEASGEEFIASPTRVEDLLSMLEKLAIASFPAGATLYSDPTGQRAERRVRVGTHGGAEFVAVIGGPLRDKANGASGLAFQRSGDQLVGLINSEIESWFAQDIDELRQRVLWEVPESLAEEVLFRRGDRDLAYWHEGSRWVPRGPGHASNVTPPAFLTLLDHLLRLKAVAWVSGEEPLEGEVQIALRIKGQEPRGVAVGRDSGGRVLGQVPGGARFELSPVWSTSLDALFR